MEGKSKVLSRLERLRHGFLESRASRKAEHLMRQLSSLSDPGFQLHRLGLKLREMPSREAAMILGQICRRGEEGDALFEQAHLHLLDKEALLGLLGEAKVASLAEELRFLGYEDARRYLAKDSPNLAFERRQEGERRPRESLGLRISLARKTLPRILERLLHDPDEKVIRTLLGNPRITEGEVLKIASSPRTPPSILSTLAHHDRWIHRYKVKLALVYNPNTPLRVSLGLLPFLLRQDLWEVAQYEALPHAVR
ncbi:MAG: hypothetical protein QHH30_04815, partial [candidate division NC10 bacterium]|nr:hypothetical protein [candidate division NC10 bacterium]